MNAMDAKTILIIWLILSGLSHLIFVLMVWNNEDFRGMRFRRLVTGTTSWYIAAYLQFGAPEGFLVLFMTVTGWLMCVAGPFLLVMSYLMYRTGKDLD